MEKLLTELNLAANSAIEFGCSAIASLENPPTPIEFLRLVRASKPAIISNCFDSHAFVNWKSRSYLESKINNATIAVTPNGRADAIVNETFVLPFEASMSMSDFLSKLSPVTNQENNEWENGSIPSNGSAYYIQSQNNNMHQEFKSLLVDIPQNIDFASIALESKPDAVNFWLGNSKSFTCFHKDHYENIYHVVAGIKRFVLVPPTQSHCMNENVYDTAMYIPSDPKDMDNCNWNIESLNPTLQTQWCATNSNTLFKHAKPITVDVHAGETLYLPALWYHSVAQIDEKMDGFSGTIAINWWYDMDFNSHSVMSSLMNRLGRIIAFGNVPQVSSDDVDDDSTESENIRKL